MQWIRFSNDGKVRKIKGEEEEEKQNKTKQKTFFKI